MTPLELIQIGLLICGILSLFIAGIQDKKNRIAPAIYLTPTLIGMGIWIPLGVLALVITFIGIIFWKDKWNEKLGLADVLLYLTFLIGLFSSVTLIGVILINLFIFFDLVIQKKVYTKEPVPMVWMAAKATFLALLVLFLLGLIYG